MRSPNVLQPIPGGPDLVKSAYNNSIQPVSPGYLQGDPFYNLVSSISGNGTTATVTCAGECSVTAGQTVTVAGSQPGNFNGTITALTADPSYQTSLLLPALQPEQLRVVI